MPVDAGQSTEPNQGTGQKGLSAEQLSQVLTILATLKEVSHTATLAANQLKLHPGAVIEGLPELLRAQFQNAVSMCVQAETIYRMLEQMQRLATHNVLNHDAGKQA